MEESHTEVSGGSTVGGVGGFTVNRLHNYTALDYTALLIYGVLATGLAAFLVFAAIVSPPSRGVLGAVAVYLLVVWAGDRLQMSEKEIRPQPRPTLFSRECEYCGMEICGCGRNQ